MEKKVFLQKLADVLQADPGQITEDLALTEENWDSTAMLGAIALIDEEFGVTVPTNELKACASVGALVGLLEQALAEGSSRG